MLNSALSAYFNLYMNHLSSISKAIAHSLSAYAFVHYQLNRSLDYVNTDLMSIIIFDHKSVSPICTNVEWL